MKRMRFNLFPHHRHLLRRLHLIFKIYQLRRHSLRRHLHHHLIGYNLTGYHPCADPILPAPHFLHQVQPFNEHKAARLQLLQIRSSLSPHRPRTSTNTGRLRHWRSPVASTDSSFSCRPCRPRTAFTPRRSRTPRPTSHSCAHYCHARLVNDKMCFALVMLVTFIADAGLIDAVDFCLKRFAFSLSIDIFCIALAWCCIFSLILFLNMFRSETCTDCAFDLYI